MYCVVYLIKQTECMHGKYEEKWYIGKVKDVDLDDDTVHITFMSNKSQTTDKLLPVTKACR